MEPPPSTAPARLTRGGRAVKAQNYAQLDRRGKDS
jgi:hypothetical protein